MVLFGLLFNPGMIPEYMNIRTLGLLNSFWSLIFSGLISSWNVIIARNFIQGIPGELEEAAKIDGCSYFGIFSASSCRSPRHPSLRSRSLSP